MPDDNTAVKPNQATTLDDLVTLAANEYASTKRAYSRGVATRRGAYLVVSQLRSHHTWVTKNQWKVLIQKWFYRKRDEKKLPKSKRGLRFTNREFIGFKGYVKKHVPAKPQIDTKIKKSFRFDAKLMINVFPDAVYKHFGYVTGKFSKFEYAVIDPARHVVNVWTKNDDNKFRDKTYMQGAKARSAIVCTNGPMMEPTTGQGVKNMYLGYADSMTQNTPWESYGVVITGGKQIHKGRVKSSGEPLYTDKWYFERTGSGSLANYSIGQGTPNPKANEALGGLIGLVNKGTVVTSDDHQGLTKSKSKNAAVWCLRPKRIGDPKGFKGAIIVVVVRGGNLNDLAQRIVKVGCSHAVAMDASNSVASGFRGVMGRSCDAKKDRIQRWGLYCR